MRRAWAIAGRELFAYFLSPVGYIVLAIFLILSGLFFYGGFSQGGPASMRAVFSGGILMLLVIGPAISMRVVAEELRMGTMEMLSTAPVTDGQIILGKFIGALLFLCALLGPTLFYVVLLEVYGRPDYGELACGYLGLFLAGAAFIAVGLLASTVTSSQVVAFLASLFFWLLLVVTAQMLPSRILQWFPGHAADAWLQLIASFDPDPRLKDFAIGLIDTSNVVFFVSITAVCLIAAVKILESKRWL